MGMSTRVEGFRPPDARWEQMEAIWEACTRAGVPVPDEVAAFFEDGKPDPTGVEVDLGASGAVRHGSEDVRGRNVVWAPAEDLCAREAACAWCDALRARVQSRTGTVG